MGHILIVEDDPVACAHFADALREEGHSIDAVDSAAQALTAARQTLPDAMLIDLRLPMADGEELLAALRRMAPLATVPAAIVTGDYSLDEQAIERLRALGAEVHFKPLWLEDVLALVAGLLGRTQRVQLR